MAEFLIARGIAVFFCFENVFNRCTISGTPLFTGGEYYAHKKSEDQCRS